MSWSTDETMHQWLFDCLLLSLPKDTGNVEGGVNDIANVSKPCLLDTNPGMVVDESERNVDSSSNGLVVGVQHQILMISNSNTTASVQNPILTVPANLSKWNKVCILGKAGYLWHNVI